MQRNMTLYINPDTGDIEFDENGDLITIFEDETTAQNVRMTLQAYKEDSPFDLRHGADHDRILGIKTDIPDDDEISEIIREAIYQENAVARIDSVTVVKSANGRALDISFSGVLENGNPISSNINTESGDKN